jgi:hypothetical protein
VGRGIREQRRVSEFRAILYQALIDEVDARFAEQVREKLQDLVDGRVDPYSGAEALVRSAMGDPPES